MAAPRKSELLRSLVAGLAASVSPARLALLLVDYKGGAAFAEAAGLPHVLGMVTDLGPDEAARALRSLEAELRRREEVLASLGLRDLSDHPAHGPGPVPPEVEPLPRLVIVVDELAALVAELPSFLDGLVQLAARGRSLGLHLVLATQRPGSVVSAAVRTNCTIRCCLRVPDESDALDVVGSPAPARLDRRRPGRAFLRRGAGDLVEVQVALVGRPRPSRAPVTVEPATFGPRPAATAVVEESGPSDLAGLVGACRSAAAAEGLAPPRPLWLPPLPSGLPASQLPTSGRDVVIGLLDDPRHQRRLPLRWQPHQGPLVAVGTGSGPVVPLQAVTRVLAARLGPDMLHVYGLDLASQGLASLAELPHVGALIRPGEHERLHRLLRRLTHELGARQAAAAATAAATAAGHAEDFPARPLVLVLVDGLSGLAGALAGTGGKAGLDALDDIERVVVDGPALGMVVAAAADRWAAVPGAWTAAASCRLVFRGGNPLELIAVGAERHDQTRWPTGRCVDLGSGLLGQVATGGFGEPARPAGDRPGGPAPVLALDHRVGLARVLAESPPRSGVDGLHLPIGIEGGGLTAAVARLRRGQPFLICGPSGSGRSTALAVVAAAARQAGCRVTAPEAGAAGLAALEERLSALGAADAGGMPLVVLVDDAEGVDDSDGVLAGLAAGHHPMAHLVATVPTDAVRGGFGHWTAELRRAVNGLVLRPRSDYDAGVLGVPLLPRWPVPLTGPGRGVLVVEGDPAPVQVAVP